MNPWGPRGLVATLAMVLCLPAGAAAQQEYPLPLPPGPTPYLAPFPVVRIVGRITNTGVRLTLFPVRAPRGSTVTVRCRGGRRKGCVVRSKTRRSPASRRVRFKRFERALKAGVRLEVFVQRGETIGTYTRFTIRKGKPPRRSEACLFPGGTRPRACP